MWVTKARERCLWVSRDFEPQVEVRKKVRTVKAVRHHLDLVGL